MALLILAGAVALLLALMLYGRLPAFVALIVVAVATGLAAGLPPAALLKSVQTGMAGTLGSIVLLLAFGVLLGEILAETGAARTISDRLLRVFGQRYIHWAVLTTGFVLGIALFYNAGFVVLAPLVFALAQATGRPLVPLAIAMAAPLSVTHGFLPPHPGATAVAVIFRADPARTLLLGLVAALPAVVVAGIVFPRFLRNMKAQPPPGLFEAEKPAEIVAPGFARSLLVALLPVGLMATDAVTALTLPPEHPARPWLRFLGDPGLALLLAVLVALLLFTRNRLNGRAAGRPGAAELLSKATSALGAVATLLLVIAAGGAFKEVLVDSGIGTELAAGLAGWRVSPLVLAWTLATLMRIAVGSATVAGMTAAGMVQPMTVGQDVSPELLTLAVGAGSLMCSHVNDTGFWMFREWFGLSVRDTFLSWTVMETIVGTIGLIMVLFLHAFSIKF
jgi:gluconate transporter